MPKATGGTSRDFFNQLARLRKPPAPPEACAQEQSRKNASILVRRAFPGLLRGALAAPRTAAAGGGHAARSSALGAPSSAVGRRACGRARRGAVAAVLPQGIGHDDDGRLPGGRLTRALPPRANGHDGGAWCEGRNRAASARWGPRSPGHPASRLHPHALPIGAAFGHGTRTHTLSRTLTGREASKCAVCPQSAARAEHLSRAPGSRAPRREHHRGADSPFASSGRHRAARSRVRSLRGGPRRPRPHGRRCARPICNLALSGASEHDPEASRVSIGHLRRDPCWRCRAVRGVGWLRPDQGRGGYARS